VITGLLAALAALLSGVGGWFLHRRAVDGARTEGYAAGVEYARSEQGRAAAQVRAEIQRQDAATASKERATLARIQAEDTAARSRPPDDLGDLLLEARKLHDEEGGTP